MYCTLSRTQSDMSGISDWRKATLPLKPLEQQTVANFKVISCELISLSIVLYNSLEKVREICCLIYFFCWTCL